MHSLLAGRNANNNDGASGPTSYRLRHAVQLEVMKAPLPARTDCNQVGTPFGRLVENCVCYISHPHNSLCSKSSAVQFVRIPFNQCASWQPVIFQLRSVTLGHLRWRNGLDWLQHM